MDANDQQKSSFKQIYKLHAKLLEKKVMKTLCVSVSKLFSLSEVFKCL